MENLGGQAKSKVLYMNGRQLWAKMWLRALGDNFRWALLPRLLDTPWPIPLYLYFP